ncbi:MAG TPA: SCP2 sterol-binding domain-containing protein [Methylococcus sp.]|nr:SCP2 sterol-binding domain-containing protein [Methylococcus sp.]
MTSELNLLAGMACRTVLEKVLSRYVTLGANGSELLRQIAGKTVTLNLAPPGVTIVFCFTPEGVQLQREGGVASDLCISGSPLHLLEAAAGSENQKGLFEGSLDVQGDMETARKIQSLLASTRASGGARIVHDFGLSLARKLSAADQPVRRWGAEVRENLRQDVSEFLQEEIRIVPAKNEAEAQFAAINGLRDAVARLEARIERMERSLREAT